MDPPPISASGFIGADECMDEEERRAGLDVQRERAVTRAVLGGGVCELV